MGLDQPMRFISVSSKDMDYKMILNDMDERGYILIGFDGISEMWVFERRNKPSNYSERPSKKNEVEKT